MPNQSESPTFRARLIVTQLMATQLMAIGVVAAAGHAVAIAGPVTVARAAPAELNLPALRRAVEDLRQTYGAKYPSAEQYLARIAELETQWPAIIAGLKDNDPQAWQQVETALALRREALMANPLLNFDRLLLVKRRQDNLGLPRNWQGNESLPKSGYDNEIVVLSPVAPEGHLTRLFRPEGGRFVGDVELHSSAKKMLFSMPRRDGQWQVFELDVEGGAARPLPLIDGQGVDNYDACYLPNGKVLFTSTAPQVGVPCVTGSSHVANVFLLDPTPQETGDCAIRQLTFDQDHNWCPTVMSDGRVLYLRWEYSDIPHFVSRILFSMNPDGTGQSAFYGSNSYWPNSMFHARETPNRPGRFVAVVSGHHDTSRMGELVLFDPARGRHEADGAVQRIGDYGKSVEPILKDALVSDSWPKFLHPWPLSDRYFLVSAQPKPDAKWGVYLADVFDNMVLLKETEGYALLEPIPIRQRKTPPIIPDRIDPERRDALVYLADVYAGPGLKEVPRGTVKKLRLFTYHFAFHNMGGQVNRVGLDGPWDVKRIMGTVPVEADGSALFRVPANTPISVQPLDAEGKALQLMRSWMTAMPGETVSCTGCHAGHSRMAANRPASALSQPAASITPWYGPTRGFSFLSEVQPVLDRHCIGCHDGQPQHAAPDFLNRPAVHAGSASPSYDKAKFPPSYLALRRYVRSHTIESDIHMLPPGEFHADTTRLVQLLRKGHHNVQLDAEAWDRLVTWIDLNTPAYGTWREIVGDQLVDAQNAIRREMLIRYAGRDEDPEVVYRPAVVQGNASARKSERPVARAPHSPQCPGWPFDAKQAADRQRAGERHQRTIELRGGVELQLVRLPAGEFVMGDPLGHPDQRPASRVKITKPFWIGGCEITNEQFRLFDATHDSGLEHGDFLQFSQEERGWSLDGPQQPASRVSWHRAMAFCRWLSGVTELRFTLPTEAQWEYACRAGTATQLAYGADDDDFSPFANLADVCLKKIEHHGWGLPIGAIAPWRLADDRFDDQHRVSAPVGSYHPNAWRLYDMHGNVAEWTRSSDRAYPYQSDDDRNDAAGNARRIVRGGSWYDRPKHARSARRVSYQPYQRIYDVGFRVVCETSSGN